MNHMPNDQTLPLTAEQRRYLSGPLVLHNPGWADCVPDWLTAAIPAARLAQVTAEFQGEADPSLATLEEVCAYLFTASLTFPLDSDHTAIYLWATAQVLSCQGRVPSVEAVFEMLGEVGVHHQILSQYQEREVLRTLRRDIRRSVTRHAPQCHPR
ncbi:hypothetical protein ANRL2_02670 [Anaerolineae bacterium]|nr:hypothetical protein ANRL2_02670 [Anaerolineae bacterium]